MSIADDITEALFGALAAVGVDEAEIPLEHPAVLSHGDYASGVALAYAKQLQMSPRALAEKLVADMNAIPGVDGGPDVLSVLRRSDGLHLNSDWGSPGSHWDGSDRFVFGLPGK